MSNIAKKGRTYEAMNTETEEIKIKANTRNSNFELLRIVAMLLIVMHHFLITTETLDYQKSLMKGGEFLNSFLVVGVNCFVLISGYFGIRLKWSKILFIFYTIFFVLIADLCLWLIAPTTFNLDYAFHTIVPFFKSSNWFIPSYLALMCISPLLEKGLGAMKRKELTQAITFLTIMNVYAYFTNFSSINPNGYNLVQFVYLYAVSHWLREFEIKKTSYAIAAYIMFSLATAAIAFGIKPGFTAFAYNQPTVVLASIALFLSFKNLKIQKSWINTIGSSTFVVFLFHYVILYYVKDISKTNNPHKILIIVGMFAFAFIVAVPLNELVRRTWKRIAK